MHNIAKAYFRKVRLACGMTKKGQFEEKTPKQRANLKILE